MELSHQLFDQLKAQFPEIELVSIGENRFQRDSIWVNITLPFNDNRNVALSELAGEISTDILMDYGYDIRGVQDLSWTSCDKSPTDFV